jgi:hypothetical protein
MGLMVWGLVELRADAPATLSTLSLEGHFGARLEKLSLAGDLPSISFTPISPHAAAVSLRGLKVAKHDHQEIFEVVRNPAAELSYRFELLRSG